MHLAWLDKGACILMDEPFGLSSALFMYNSKPDDGIALFLLSMGHSPLLPSLAIPGLPSLPNQPTLDKEEAYLTEVSCIALRL